MREIKSTILRVMRVNVLWVCNFTDIVLGSFGDHIRALARTLRKDGGTLICSFPASGFPWEKDLREWAVVVDYGNAASLCRRSGIDVVHSHYNPTNKVALAAAIQCHAPLVAHWHAAPPRDTLLKRLLKRAVLQHGVTHHLAVSGYVSNAVSTHYGVDKEHVSIIPNGVDTGRFVPSSPKKGRIVVVANFRPEKDHATFLRSLAFLRDLPLEVVLVGDGPLRQSMESYASQLGLSSVVTFAGKRSDVPTILAASDFAVLPTLEEAFSYSSLEAMAAGLPVIATAVGGIPELVQHERNGLLYPVGDATVLAQSIRRLYLDPQLRRHLADGARQTSLRLTVEEWARRVLFIYKEISG